MKYSRSSFVPVIALNIIMIGKGGWNIKAEVVGHPSVVETSKYLVRAKLNLYGQTAL